MPQSQTTIVGNLGDDPDLRFTPQGVAVTRMRIAVANRYFDGNAKKWEERDPDWYTVNCWRNLAENVADSLQKGDRVIVSGTMHQRSYEKDDETRYVWELEATDVGAALTFATASVKKMEREKASAKDEVSQKRATKSRGTTRKSSRNNDEDEVPF